MNKKELIVVGWIGFYERTSRITPKHAWTEGYRSNIYIYIIYISPSILKVWFFHVNYLSYLCSFAYYCTLNRSPLPCIHVRRTRAAVRTQRKRKRVACGCFRVRCGEGRVTGDCWAVTTAQPCVGPARSPVTSPRRVRVRAGRRTLTRSLCTQVCCCRAAWCRWVPCSRGECPACPWCSHASDSRRLVRAARTHERAARLRAFIASRTPPTAPPLKRRLLLTGRPPAVRRAPPPAGPERR